MEMEGREQSLRKRVRQQMLDLMEKMDFSFSTRLLSENQMAAKFQVSRSTIRAVLTELETEGKVIRRHGSGTYVNPPALHVTSTLYPRVNMMDLIRKNGYEPGKKVLGFRNIQAEERGSYLNLFPFDQITEVRTIYCAGARPCMYCIDCVDAKRFDGVNWWEYERYPNSIYQFIRMQVDIELVWDIIKVQAAHSSQMPALKKCFSVPDGVIKPLVHLEITNFDKSNQPSLWGNIYVDTDLVCLNIVRDLTGL